MTAASRKKLLPIPDYLIYEMDDGKPIYYRGYKEVSNGNKTFEGISGNGVLDSLISALISNYISSKLDEKYFLLSSNLQLHINSESWRLIKIAIFDKKELAAAVLKSDNEKIIPKIVLDIGTKAHFEFSYEAEFYFHRKIDQLLNYGIEKVIWLYTHSKKITIAEKDQRWETANWTEDIEIMPGIVVNILQLIEEFYQQEED